MDETGINLTTGSSQRVFPILGVIEHLALTGAKYYTPGISAVGI